MKRSSNLAVTLSQQSGFGLIELMIAMTLGLILSVTVIQVFIGARQTFDVQQRQSIMQEDARFALNRLASDIRMAGGFGCLQPGRLPLSTAMQLPPEFVQPISYSGGVLRLLTAVAVSDVVAVASSRRASQYGARWLIATDCLGEVRIAENDPLEVSPGDWLIPVRQLDYRRSNASLQVRTNGAGNHETLINGVAGFELQFALAPGLAGGGLSGAYHPQLGADDAARIRSVRLRLTLSDNPADPANGLVAPLTQTLVATLRNRMD